MTRTMLANQFAVGLRQEIKIKVAGIEGNFEQLLAKVKLEEAKLRDIGNPTGSLVSTRKQPSLPRGDRTGQTYQYASNNQKRCYNYNATGHFSRNCPVRGCAAPVESRGRNNSNQGTRKSEARKVATIVPENSKTQTEGQEKIAELREALKQAKIEESLKDASTMINVLTPAKGNKNDNITLGLTLTSEVAVEGKTVKALLDTGSPVTILLLDLLFNHWAQQKKAGQTVEQWKEEVRNRLQNPSLILRNYGGNELDILKETTFKLERGGYSYTVVVLLKKNPPHDLLIGTDLLPLLGFQKTVNSKIALDMFTAIKSVMLEKLKRK